MGDPQPGAGAHPPGVYHGWMCVSEHEGIVVNVPDLPLRPATTRTSTGCRRTRDEIPYDWSRRMG